MLNRQTISNGSGLGPLILGALLVAGCNMHLWQGAPPSALIYRHGAVLAGDWYRLLTHVLVHVSWYHLLLDVGATCLLLAAMRTPVWQKLLAVMICGLTSLGYSLFASPIIYQTGFCGLSGIAHGLMFVVGGLWLFSPRTSFVGKVGVIRIVGFLFCLLSLGKSSFEVVSGQVLFAGAHQGQLGVPIVHSHLGGVFGGFLVVFLLAVCNRKS